MPVMRPLGLRAGFGDGGQIVRSHRAVNSCVDTARGKGHQIIPILSFSKIDVMLLVDFFYIKFN